MLEPNIRARMRRAGQYRVLVVEDNPGDAELSVAWLNEAPWSSFEVRTAPTVKEGAALLTSFAADMIILDLNLPDSIGLETLVRIKRIAQQTPVIVVSGLLTEKVRREAIGAGAEGVFTKSDANSPLFPWSVLSVIERNRSFDQHRQLKTLLETTPDAMLVVNAAGVVRYVNGAALFLFGRKRKELLGDLLGFSVRDGEPTEIVIPLPGKLRICEMRVAAFEWQGEPAFLGSIRDVTELKNSQKEATEKAKLAEDRFALLRRMLDEIAALAQRLGLSEVALATGPLLRTRPSDPLSEHIFAAALAPFETAFRGFVEANAKLAEQNRELADAKATVDGANQELDAFSYSVAHDLRAPLRAINGFSQALVEDVGENLDVQAQDHLRRIREAAERMAQLIDDLLRLSRVTRHEVYRRKVNLSDLARIVVGELQSLEPSRKMELQLQDGVVVDGDEHLLQLAITNLIGNAWKFTAKTSQPKIEFGYDQTASERIFFVRDNGSGFDPSCARNLFGVFQRLHSTSEFDGTGIGLSIVRRVVQRHGGRVWAEGEVGKGATFYFTLGATS